MSRSDIGNYIGISLEAVSRLFRALSSRGVIAFRNRRHVKIIDRAGLNDIASESEMPRLPRRRAGPAGSPRLQLTAPAHAEEKLVTVALMAERVLGTAADRLGTPPLLAS